MAVAAEINELTERVIGAAIKVHKVLGPGFAEAAYQKAMEVELRLRSIRCQPQASIQLYYKDELVGEGRMDLLIEDQLVVELKAADRWNDLFDAQLLSYLRASRLPLGLVINFNVNRLYEGVKRVINT